MLLAHAEYGGLVLLCGVSFTALIHFFPALLVISIPCVIYGLFESIRSLRN